MTPLAKTDTSADEGEAGAPPKVPKWISEHFRASLDSIELLTNIVHISARGISVLQGMPKIVQLLAEVEGNAQEVSAQDRLQRAKEEAELAANEVAQDFPVLHGFAVVAVWSWLEHFVKGFVGRWVMHRPDALEVPAVQKLRVRIGDYLPLSPQEQANFLVELLEQDLASPMKRGTGRFMSLLEPFSLTFALTEKCTTTIFELQQVRNAIAHQNGCADRRLVSSCPWLSLEHGQRIQIDRKMVRRYSAASTEFLLALLYRVSDLYGVDLRSPRVGAPAEDAASIPPGDARDREGESAQG